MKKFMCNVEDVSEEFEAEDLDKAIEFVNNRVDIHEIRKFDYCDNCKKEIIQIDLGDGSFGCPICKRMDCISIETEIID